MSNYRRIRYEDRCQIYAPSKHGSSQESIAEVLGVSQSAVSREIHRNRGQRNRETPIFNMAPPSRPFVQNRRP